MALIGLAHALGCEVTAENVETAEQLARLRDLGCGIAQGYYLSGPSSGAEMTRIPSVADGEPQSKAFPRSGIAGLSYGIGTRQRLLSVWVATRPTAPVSAGRIVGAFSK